MKYYTIVIVNHQDVSPGNINKQKIFIVGVVLILIVIIPALVILLVWQKQTRYLTKTPARIIDNTLSKSSTNTQWQLTSKHPWPMFHGNYNHTGYKDVKGPSRNKLRWKFFAGKQEGRWPNSVAISSEGTIYLAGVDKLFALDKNGKQKWSKNYARSQGPAIGNDGIIYFVAENSIIAINNSGDEKWRFLTQGNTIFGPTLGPDGTIYQGSWDGYFYALNSDGSLKWKYKTSGAISYPPSIDKGGTIYLGGGDVHSGPDSNVYAFDKSGNILWKYDTRSNRVGSPAIAPDGTIYLPAAPTLFALDSSGNLKWKKGPNIGFPQVQGVMAQVFGPPPGQSTKQDISNGSNNQQNQYSNNNQNMNQSNQNFQRPNTQGFSQNQPESNQGSQDKGDIAGIITPAIGPDGTIYIGTSQGAIYAINPETQEILWQYKVKPDPNKLDHYGLPSFPIIDKDSTVYFGSFDGNMYAIDKNGQLKWSYQTSGKITEAAPALGSDGTLYFTSEDGYLYALGE